VLRCDTYFVILPSYFSPSYHLALQLEKDGIVSSSWLLPLYRERWLTMLRVEQGADNGPPCDSGLDCTSLRCGRKLLQDIDYCWRWNGYNFGLDLLITYDTQVFRSS